MCGVSQLLCHVCPIASAPKKSLQLVAAGAVKDDVRALRHQLSQAKEHATAADALAESASHLRAALSAIAAAASSGELLSCALLSQVSN